MMAPRSAGLAQTPRRAVSLAGALSVSALVIGFGMLAMSQPTNARAAASLRAGQLAIVDCLLPAVVRQLGGMMSYLGPREPVKTSASECEIRGGEYAAYDRANFATALQVWLPKAKEGDAQAQNYVGEIFEKGMGTPADFVKAAEWYRKAAEQNYVKAESNLGYLYEEGLGVPKDTVQALNWYRKSSGINDDDLTFVSELTAVRNELHGQIDAISAQLEEQTSKADTLQQQVEQSRERISKQTARLASARRQTDQLRSRIAQLQTAADAAAVVSPEKVAEMQKVQADLKERQMQLDADEAELGALKRTSSDAELQLSERLAVATADATRLRVQLGEKTTAAETATSQLAAANAQLTAIDGEVKRLATESKDARDLLAAAKATAPIPVNTAQVRALTQEVRGLMQKVEASEQTIGLLQVTRRRYETQVSDMTRAAAANQQKLQASRAELASLQAWALDVDHRLIEASQRTTEQELQLALDKERLAVAQRDSEEMRVLQSTLAEREAKLCEERSKVAGLQAEALTYKSEIAQLRSQSPVDGVTGRTAAADGAGEAAKGPTKADLSRDLLGNYYALVIGNDIYQNMPNLSTAVSDVESLANVLEKKYGFKVRILRNATNDEIMTAINEYRITLRANDNLLIYYAGHGEVAEKTFRGYWLPVNAKRDDTTAWISDEMVTEQLNLMSARHVMIVADSCYAGAMTRSGGLQIAAREGADAEVKRLRYLAGRQSRTVLTSGGVAPVMDGGPNGHSLFARAIVDALQKNDGVLEGASLYNEIFDPVRSGTKRLFHVDQSPMYAKIRDAGHQNGEFLFVPRTI